MVGARAPGRARARRHARTRSPARACTRDRDGRDPSSECRCRRLGGEAPPRSRRPPPLACRGRRRVRCRLALPRRGPPLPRRRPRPGFRDPRCGGCPAREHPRPRPDTPGRRPHPSGPCLGSVAGGHRKPLVPPRHRGRPLGAGDARTGAQQGPRSRATHPDRRGDGTRGHGRERALAPPGAPLMEETRASGLARLAGVSSLLLSDLRAAAGTCLDTAHDGAWDSAHRIADFCAAGRGHGSLGWCCPRWLDARSPDIGGHLGQPVSQTDVPPAGQQGQPDGWGQEPAALPEFRTEENQYSAVPGSIRLSSTTSLRTDPLVRGRERWRDAAADTFWLDEQSLGDKWSRSGDPSAPLPCSTPTNPIESGPRDGWLFLPVPGSVLSEAHHRRRRCPPSRHSADRSPRG